MPINSISTSTINLTANVIRYSLFADIDGNGFLSLKRCSVSGNDWVDDPTEGSNKTIILPITFKSIIVALFSMLKFVFGYDYDKVQINRGRD